MSENSSECHSNFKALLQFVHDNLAVLVMIALVTAYMIYTYHIMHAHDLDQETLRWARGKIDETQTALISFLTGGVVGYKMATTKTTSTPPNPPTAVKEETKLESS